MNITREYFELSSNPKTIREHFDSEEEILLAIEAGIAEVKSYLVRGNFLMSEDETQNVRFAGWACHLAFTYSKYPLKPVLADYIQTVRNCLEDYAQGKFNYNTPIIEPDWN